MSIHLSGFRQKTLFMKLFERVKLLAKHHAMTLTALAGELGVPQSTFSNYFNEKSEHNLFNYLEKILAVFPDANRVWLYCEEGEMLKGGGGVVVKPLRTAMPPMRAAMSRGQDEAVDEVIVLRTENDALKNKLIAALEDNKRLHEQLARMSGDSDFMHPADGERPVPGARRDGMKE